jgi:hypothetical protein
LDSVEQGERVEGELDAFIERRHDQRVKDEGERAREELWQASVRRYNARQSENLLSAWYEYEMRLYRIHSGLALEHLEKAEKYIENGQEST